MRFIIREPRSSDLQALARLHVETFIETHTEAAKPPTFEIREWQWRKWLQSPEVGSFSYVVEDLSGELVGFARGTLHDGGVPGFEGELNKIYLRKRCHRLGLGRRLVGIVARRFLEQGVRSMLLFGDAGNPSNGFYEHLGAERLFDLNGRFHGSYGWRDLEQLAALCDRRDQGPTNAGSRSRPLRQTG